MEDKKFPIYNLKSVWRKGETEKTLMTKELLTQKTLDELISRFEVNVRKANNVKGCIVTKIRFIEHESWCLTWFNHYTFNVHYTDAEIIQSFSKFVARKLPMQRALERSHYDNNTDPKYCLMGAEDRYRWNICRCEHCQKRGVVTIDH